MKNQVDEEIEAAAGKGRFFGAFCNTICNHHQLTCCYSSLIAIMGKTWPDVTKLPISMEDESMKAVLLDFGS